jgi:hypothetical protein
MPEVLDDLVHLPLGAHCVSFHASRDEAADQAVSFLAGSPDGQAASFWVADSTLLAYYDEKLAVRAPEHVGCVHVLPHEQVGPVAGKLRPVEEVQEFVAGHPGGVTGGADTLSFYWSPETIPDHLEYEQWFEDQPREGSRFLCPYDLRRIPPESAPEVLRELGKHHSHAALSASDEPAVRLLQLFIFGGARDLPPQLLETLRWARDSRLIERGDDLVLTESGEAVVRDWSRAARFDW